MAAGSAERLAGRRIAVTGGAGFIGTHLVRQLLRDGARVDLLGPLPRERREGGRWVGDTAVRYWPAALSGNHTFLESALQGCDSIVHLAYEFPRSMTFWDRLADEVNTNLLTAIRIAAAAEAARVAFICFASSVAVYGSTDSYPFAERSEEGLAATVRENALPEGETPYGAVKLMQEACFQRWARRTGRRAAILRLATVYGPGETVNRAVPNFIRAVLAGRSPVVDGDGLHAFDVIFVADAVEAFIMALAHRPDKVFNIGTGRGHTPREIATLITRLCHSDVPILEDGVARRGAPICDVSRAATELGFRARTPLEVGLWEEIRWLQTVRAGAPPTSRPEPAYSSTSPLRTA